MKKLLISLSTAMLAITPIISLKDTITTSTKQENVKNEISMTIPITNDNNTIAKTAYSSNQTPTPFDAGRNGYDYYFLYHVIWLSNDKTKLVNDNLAAGVSAIAAIIAEFIPEAAAMAPAIATLLVVQWNIWNVPSYNAGRGVAIGMYGAMPTIITTVYGQ